VIVSLDHDMTLLDRYIIRQYIVAAFFGLLSFLCIFLIIDLTEKIDDFLDAKVPTEIILQYYVAFAPEILKLMTPVAMLLAALFVTGRLSTQNELAAMKSSGISLYRILLPFLAVAMLVVGLSVYLNGWIVPASNQQKYYIERTYLHRGGDPSQRFNIFFQVGQTRIVTMNYFDTQTHTASRVSIQDFADTNLTVLYHRYDALRMQWQAASDSTKQGWVLLNGDRRGTVELTDPVIPYQRMYVGTLNLMPEDIEKKQRRPDEMQYGDLREFIQSQQRAGQDVSRWLVDYHSKLAFPFASIIMVLFGVPFAAGRARTGAALGFGIAVAVTFIYLAFMKISQVFGYNGDVDPLLTAWMANGMFFVAAIVNLLRVQK
jgi:lipopolysaccharide export system permease protein